MRIDALTLFPEMFVSPLESSILARARAAGLFQFQAVDIRGFALDRHRTVDDTPFGGGAGMVMMPDPLFRAVEATISAAPPPGPNRILLLTPVGRPFDQEMAAELAQEDHLLLVCGRYEGIDERVHEHLITDEISIGDYVLTGGEVAALVVIDAVVRLVPGVVGRPESTVGETFSERLLEYPQYTRPASFRGWRVPEVLLSGNHEAVRRWRRQQSLVRTMQHRPDLFRQHRLTAADLEILGMPRPKRRERASEQTEEGA